MEPGRKTVSTSGAQQSPVKASGGLPRPSPHGIFHGRPPFYSALLRAVEQSRQASASAPQWWATLQAAHGVRKEELDWLGLERWLGNRPIVARSDLLEFVRANQVQLREIVKRSDGLEERRSEAIRLVKELKQAGYSLSDGGPSKLESLHVVRGKLRYLISSEEDVSRLPPKIAAIVIRLYQTLHEWQSERVLQASDEMGSSTARHAEYSEPGGERYRELLLVWPRPSTDELDTKIRDLSLWPTDALVARRPKNQPELDQLNTAWEHIESFPEFRSRNWREPNVIAHVRMTERLDTSGERVLFLEELQSDWHQAGRRKGYLNEISAADLAEMRRIAAFSGTRPLTPGESTRLAEMGSRATRLTSGQPRAVALAPFRATWPVLLIKRAVRWAVDRGINRIAWSTGEQQARRYGQTRHILALCYRTRPSEKDSFELSGLTSKGLWIDLGQMTASKLEHFVGSQSLQQIRAGDGKLAECVPQRDAPSHAGITVRCGSRIVGEYQNHEDAALALAAAGTLRCLEPVDLHVGGRGLRALYDHVLPNQVAAYLKKTGARVRQETLEVGGTTESAVQRRVVHTFDITPALRDLALTGQPLFRHNLVVGGMPVKRLTDILNQAVTRAGWQQCPPLSVVQSVQDLPPPVRHEVLLANAERSVGALISWHSGKPTVYFVADHTSTQTEAIGALVHEVVGHWGLRLVMNADRYATLMDGIWRDTPGEVRRAAARSGLDRDSAGRVIDIAYDETRRRTAAEEVIAYEAERLLGGAKRDGRIARWWSAVVDAVRSFLCRLGARELTAEDRIASLLRESNRALKASAVTGHVVFEPDKKASPEDPQLRVSCSENGVTSMAAFDVSTEVPVDSPPFLAQPFD